MFQAQLSRVQNKALQSAELEVGSWGVVTAGHNHTSPLAVEIRSESCHGAVLFVQERTKSLPQPTAALRGSILSPQEVVTLFWNQRPIILGHIIVEYIRTPIILSVTSFKKQRTTG